MRKYAHPQAAVCELCFRRPRGRKTFRTGRLENNLGDLSILTKEMIVQLREQGNEVFFVRYTDDEEMYAFHGKTASVPVNLANNRGTDYVLKVKLQPRARKHKPSNTTLVNIFRLTVEDGPTIEHVNKDMLEKAMRRLLARGRIACVVSTAIEVDNNHRHVVYNKMQWTPKTYQTDGKPIKHFDKAFVG